MIDRSRARGRVKAMVRVMRRVMLWIRVRAGCLGK